MELSHRGLFFVEFLPPSSWPAASASTQPGLRSGAMHAGRNGGGGGMYLGWMEGTVGRYRGERREKAREAEATGRPAASSDREGGRKKGF